MFGRSALALAVVVVGSLVTAAPAQAATYAVTLSASATKGDVGQSVTLSGKVTGTQAAQKTILVQRKIGSGAWTTIARPRTTSSRSYSYKTTLAAVGTQQYRVLAPRTGSTGQGLSATRTVTGFSWLNLSKQPHFVIGSAFFGTSPVVLGTARPRSIEIGVDQPGGVTEGIGWNLAGRCDRADLRFGLTTSDETVSSELDVQTESGGLFRDVTGFELTTVDVVTPSTTYLQLRNLGPTFNIVAVTPRVHCSVAELPPAGF